MKPTVKPRRKPLQPRAWLTSGAIQEAYLRLLVEHGDEAVAMREIAAVAGVALGTLYQYFPGQDSIAAVTVHSWMRKQAAALAEAAHAPGPRTLDETLRALVAAHVRPLLTEAAEWRALLQLERRLTPPQTYREIYNEYVALVRDALAAASDWPAALDPQRAAYAVFTTVNALVTQSLLVQEPCPPVEALMHDALCAAAGYITAARSG